MFDRVRGREREAGRGRERDRSRGLGFRVQGSGFRIEDLVRYVLVDNGPSPQPGFGIEDLGFQV